ncbi:hypothetical protein BN2476_560042 [Paraburkholderia piptadeniae]|uniref:Uncharacterized protein n=1 Tax=Paraburkholderia piptadeniae TaxID=1701573 RepID=A0A1N7SIJ0_9BURK|nr:hypothetical protein BN2476_560042 [Paraburkholderia piptadeniae]
MFRKLTEPEGGFPGKSDFRALSQTAFETKLIETHALKVKLTGSETSTRERERRRNEAV